MSMADISRFEIEFRPIQPILFVIDCSEFVQGEKIEAVNSVMREIVSDLKENDYEWVSREPMLNVLKYSEKAEWVSQTLMRPCDMVWEDITAGEGATLAALSMSLQACRGKSFCVCRTGKSIPTG